MNLAKRVKVFYNNYANWIIAIALCLVILLGSIYRISHLGAYSLSTDEAVLWKISSQPTIWQVIKQNALGNSAPLLYASLMHFLLPWISSDFSIRLLSGIAGILAIPAMFFLSRRFSTVGFALIGAGFIAFSASQIDFSSELREYSLTALLTILILLFYSAYQGYKNTSSILGLTLVSAIGLFTQYGISFYVLSVVLVIAYDLVTNWDTQPYNSKRNFILYSTVVLLCVIAVWYSSLRFQASSGGFAGSGYLSSGYWDGTLGSFWTLVWENTWSLFDFAFSQFFSTLLFFLVVLGIGGLIASKRSKYLAILLLPVLFTFLFSLVRFYPYIGYRQNISLTISLYILALLGIQELFSIRKYAAYAVLAIGLVLAFESGSIGRPQLGMREGVKEVCASLSPSDYIYTDDDTAARLEYYWQNCDPNIVMDPAFSFLLQNPPTHILINVPPEQLENKKITRLWVVLSELPAQKQDRLLASLRDVMGTTEISFFFVPESKDGAQIYLYDKGQSKNQIGSTYYLEK